LPPGFRSLEDFGSLMQFESVQLFVERASAANRKFQLTDENASSVAQICSRLDGIPLAIELSASRITAFSPEQIAKRLDDRFKLLTGGSRTALPRQQTLRALIDWSYDLLEEPERALLRRLSVFAGGWTFEAAETICNNLDVFEYLPHLINKSLVVMNDAGDEPRYSLLETIRQYARDKLLENGEGEGTRNRHLDYFLAMAETAEEYMLTSMAGKWMNQLEIELDNMRTALEWGPSNNIESALRVAGALAYFWLTKSHELEGLRWITEALAQSKSIPGQWKNLSDQQIRNRAKALNAIAILSYSQGQNVEIYTAAKEAVALWRQIGEKRYLAIALGYLAISNVFLGNGAEALTAKDEALMFARESNDKFFLAVTLSVTVQVAAVIQGDFKIARAYSEKAIAIMRENGNHWFVGIALFGLGMMEIQQGNFDEARSKFKSAQSYLLEMGDKHRINMISSELAHIERYEGHYQQARVLYAETLREWQRIGHRAAVTHQLESIAFIAKALEQTDRSARLLGAAESLREKIGTDMTPQEREEYEKEVADLKANIDEKLFASLWADGRSMTMEEAIELALE
jgi:tetratricopeptide (TPR) repeat protein